jgi:hypothetical protein
MRVLGELPDAHPGGSILEALIAAHGIFPAYHGSALVDGALHGISVQRHAPAIAQAAHARSTPWILNRQFCRDIVVAHQQNFNSAAARFTRGAGYDWTDIRRVHGRFMRS